jgi:hypothetical protein
MWVPTHHSTVRPPVEDGGDGLQIRMVAANILDKQSRTADKGLLSNLRVRSWLNPVGGSCEHGTEPSSNIKVRKFLD